MLTHESLVAAGYKRHQRMTALQWLNEADGLYQKCIYANNGDKSYFVNVYWYDHEKHNSPMPGPDGWMPEVQFNLRDDARHGYFTVTVGATEQATIESVEEFFAKMYGVMGCRPHEVKGEDF